MVARYAGASLGLFAFAVAVGAGLYAQNPPMVTLSRGILALFSFFFLGLIFGRVAQSVIGEHEQARRMEIERQYGDPAGGAGSSAAASKAPGLEGVH